MTTRQYRIQYKLSGKWVTLAHRPVNAAAARRMVKSSEDTAFDGHKRPGLYRAVEIKMVILRVLPRNKA